MHNEKILIVSPHPDDETLGAGGTILKYKNSGHRIYWLNITNMKEEYGFKKEEVKRRNSEIERVIDEYKFDGFFDLELKPAGLDEYPLKSVIEKISGVFTKVEPGIVILPYRDDIHSDHRIVFDASHACTKVFKYPSIKKILMMEVVSETDFSYGDKFSPNCFMNISDYLEKKLNIAKIYENELKEHPFPRSAENMKAFATFRGAMAGVKYAEAFMTLKEIL